MSEATWTKLPRHQWTDKQGNLRVSKWEVHISTDHPTHPGCYGYFEHDDHGEGGGLWFDGSAPLNGQWALSDYDGVTGLPESVWMALRAAGFHVSEDFE